MNRKIVWFRLPYYKTVGGWANIIKNNSFKFIIY